jgi:6,7-dimethyl-8-ribityllumazine synthase
MNPSDGPDRRDDEEDDLERASENVLGGWPSARLEDPPEDPVGSPTLDGDQSAVAEPGPVAPPELAPDEPEEAPAADGTDLVAEPGEAPAADGADVVAEPEEAPAADGADVVAEPEEAPAEDGTDVVAEPEDADVPVAEATGEHAPGDLTVPPGYAVLEGEARGARRAVGIVVSRFNGEVTGGLLESALGELEELGVERDSITVMPVPGAFELPLAAMALAKTRRFACIVALGCVIRGDTPHFDYVASEAASGLQLAAIETGVPVSFGVLTLDRADQAPPRLEKGAEAVRTALEMADVFANLRAAAAR